MPGLKLMGQASMLSIINWIISDELIIGLSVNPSSRAVSRQLLYRGVYLRVFLPVFIGVLIINFLLQSIQTNTETESNKKTDQIYHGKIFKRKMTSIDVGASLRLPAAGAPPIGRLQNSTSSHIGSPFTSDLLPAGPLNCSLAYQSFQSPHSCSFSFSAYFAACEPHYDNAPLQLDPGSCSRPALAPAFLIPPQKNCPK